MKILRVRCEVHSAYSEVASIRKQDNIKTGRKEIKYRFDTHWNLGLPVT